MFVTRCTVCFQPVKIAQNESVEPLCELQLRIAMKGLRDVQNVRSDGFASWKIAEMALQTIEDVREATMSQMAELLRRCVKAEIERDAAYARLMAVVERQGETS